MAPRDDETYRNRRRKNEPDWAPNYRPERRRDDKRERRKTTAPPIEQRFDEIAHERIERYEQKPRQYCLRPAGFNRDCQRQWKYRRDQATNVGYKAMADVMPQSTGLGTPIIHSPVPMMNPKAEFTASCARNRRLRRVPASSRAAVVLW